MGATVKESIAFYSVAYYFTAAVRTFRRQQVNCTFKAIEDMRLACKSDLKRFVIFITASFTAFHLEFLLSVSDYCAPGMFVLSAGTLYHTREDLCDSPAVPRYLLVGVAQPLCQEQFGFILYAGFNSL